MYMVGTQRRVRFSCDMLCLSGVGVCFFVLPLAASSFLQVALGFSGAFGSLGQCKKLKKSHKPVATTSR